MNDSFEVILNNEEFQKYKQLQKNSEVTTQTLQGLVRDIENYKLKSEQYEVTIRNHQLKIKELSKNSIRLSRRLIVEQEEHFNTQETFLAREKQLLEKMLTLSNEHENNTAYLINARQTKHKVEGENGMLKKKIVDLERLVQKLNLQARQAKKQQSSLQDRCTSLEGEFLAVSNACTQLKNRIQLLLSDSKERERVIAKNMKADSQAQQLRIIEITSFYEQKIKQLQSVHRERVKNLTYQIEQLNTKVHQKTQDYNLIYQYKEELENKYHSLLFKNQNTSAKINRLKLSIQAMKKYISDNFEQIELDVWKYKSSIKMDQDKMVEYMKKVQLSQKIKIEQKKAQRKDQLIIAMWKKLQPDLQMILKQLRNDSIVQWQIIVTLQFGRVVEELKISLQKVLKQCFNSWLSK